MTPVVLRAFYKASQGVDAAFGKSRPLFSPPTLMVGLNWRAPEEADISLFVGGWRWAHQLVRITYAVYV